MANRSLLCVRFFALLLVSACLFSAHASANQQPSLKLSEDLEQELDAATSPVRALVVFELPSPPPNQSNAEAAQKRRADIATIAGTLKTDFGNNLGQARAFDQVAALAADLTKATATALANRPDVKSLDLDQRLTLSLETAIPLLGMDQLHAITDPIGGIQGFGGKLAVIDSGVVEVPDLEGAVLAEACFCQGCCVSGSDEAFGPGSAVDEFGHGTRVLGTALSRGVVAGIGPAPQAEAIVAKVVAADGSMYMSDIIAALDWIADSHPETDVVNMSLGTSLTFLGDCNGEATWLDVFEEAIDLVIANGALVVASAGNGAVQTEMSAPACLSQVISVGATYVKDYFGTIAFSACSDTNPLQDQLACFSNVSATTDVMAPGAILFMPGIDGSPCSGCGTSFSAPLVAGCLTQIMAAEPSAAQSVLKASLAKTDVLVSTASGDVPRLDCLGAYRSVRTVFYDSFEADE